MPTSKIDLGLVYGLNGRPTGEVFMAIEDINRHSLVVFEPSEALELAEGLAAIAFIAQEKDRKPAN